MIFPYVSKVIILTTVLHTILALDVCRDKENANCQSCGNIVYPREQFYRENCMKTCGVCTVTNVAYNKPTNQSSTYNDSSHGEAISAPSRAVDGNLGQVWGSTTSSCTHTLDGSPSWWCVDLQQIYNIDSFKLFNRDILQGRLSGFEIKISSGGQCDESGFNSATSCHNDTSTIQSIYNIESCDQQQSLSARTVFVSVNNEVVTLCEVQIFSDPIQCNTGYYSTSRSTCQPCDKCLNAKCDPDTGVCTDRCKDGYYGDKCQPCNTCLNDRCDPTTGVCTDGCKDGYYGDKCTSSCSNKCTNSRCYITPTSSQPQCTTGCVDGNAGSYCGTPCPANCKSCQQYGSSCIECNQGWYDTNCQKICSDGCVSKMCNKPDGTCVCKVTYYGDKCESPCSNKCTNSRCYIPSSPSQPQCTTGCVDGNTGPYCQSSCLGNCRSCQQHGPSCNECNQGWYGTSCESQCPDNCVGGCGKIDGRCNECKPDTAGPYCNITCGTGCQPTTDHTTCDRTGKCTECIVGKHGDGCDKNCSTGCDGGCDRNGRCTDCIIGRYGYTCDMNCSTGCDGGCDRSSGACTNCIVGRYGNDCDMNCSTVCDGECDRGSGRCINCIVGRYGNDCDMNCSTGCDGGCDRNGRCTDCIKGKTGERCDINCTNNCTVCNQDDSSSCTECKDGRWGSSCSKLCNTNCKPVVGTTGGKCNITIGSCTEGCKTRFYGMDCNKDCPSNCKDGLCDQQSGNCINGCLPGKIGPNCTTDCEPGMYGDKCTKECGNCAQNRPCDISDGTCEDGCADGFQRPTCQMKEEAEKIVEGTSISPIASGIIGVLCGIAGTVAVVLSYHFYMKRPQSSQPKAENDPDYVYSNTDLNPTTSTTDDTLTTGYQNIPTNTRNVDYVNQSFNTEDNTRNMYDTLDLTPNNTQHTYTTLDSDKVHKAKH